MWKLIKIFYYINFLKYNRKGSNGFMRYEIKYLININPKIESIKKLAQYLTLYSTIFFSEDGKKVEIVDKATKKIKIMDSCIKNIGGDKHNYYIISIFQEEEVNYLECFDKLINEIFRTQKDITEEKFFILEDGISRYYSSKAYPKLFHTENLLRSFITEMMCFFGPENWARNMGGKLVNNKNQNSEYKNTFLYSSDFKHLEVFLTKVYKEYDSDELLKEIRDKLEQINDKSKIEEAIKIKNDIRKNKPYTIWSNFVKKYAKTDLEIEQFTKIMDRLYVLRCKIAHSNLFRKSDYDEFEKLTNKIINQTKIMTNQIEKGIEIDQETTVLLNEVAGEIDEKNPDRDTLIVPAKPDGFDNVFLKENRWYYIRISDEKINQIKYIAAYEAQKNKCIQYYAEVDYIENSEIKPGYKVVYFKEHAKLLSNGRKIKIVNNQNYAPQSIRYVSSRKLFDENIKTLDQLFN